MAEFVDVLFSDFVPDRGGTPWPENPGYLVDANGARPTLNGWVTGLDATAVATAFAGATVLAAFEANDIIFVATTKEIWETRDKGLNWADNKQATYGADVADNWCFTQFDELVVATNRVTQPQKKDIGAGTFQADFADLSGVTAGSGAEVCCRVRDHLVFGGLYGAMSSGIATNLGGQSALRWSSIGDPEAWPEPGSATALSTQAGAQVLPAEYGYITGLVGFERYGLVFQERAVTRMTYEGGNVVYQFDRISQGVGSGIPGVSSPQAFVTVDGITYFWNRAGIYATDGYKIRPISAGRLDASLFSSTLSHPDQLGAITHAVHDPARRSIYFIAQNLASFGNARTLAYDYVLDRFYLVAPTTLLALFNSSASTTAAAGTDGIHAAWGVAGHTLQRLTAVPTTVDLQTGFIELVPGKRVQLQGAHILGSGTTTPTIGFKGADNPNSLSIVQTGFTSMTAAARDIKQTARDTNRFFSFRVTGAQGAGATIRGLRIYYNEATGS